MRVSTSCLLAETLTETCSLRAMDAHAQFELLDACAFLAEMSISVEAFAR